MKTWFFMSKRPPMLRLWILPERKITNVEKKRNFFSDHVTKCSYLRCCPANTFTLTYGRVLNIYWNDVLKRIISPSASRNICAFYRSKILKIMSAILVHNLRNMSNDTSEKGLIFTSSPSFIVVGYLEVNFWHFLQFFI